MSHMPFWRFQIFSTIGGCLWAVVIGAAGYLLGNNLPLIQRVIQYVGFGGLLVLVLVVVAIVVLRRRAARS